MKLLNIKKRLNYKEADILIEKYYEGLTSNEEELQLHAFLANDNLPEKYKAEQAMFGYFKTKKAEKKIKISFYYQWAAVAAIVLVTALSAQFFAYEKQDSYALVNGEKVTNLNDIENLALASMSEMTSKNEIEESLRSINTNEIVSKQLEVFNEIDK